MQLVLHFTRCDKPFAPHTAYRCILKTSFCISTHCCYRPWRILGKKSHNKSHSFFKSCHSADLLTSHQETHRHTNGRCIPLRASPPGCFTVTLKETAVIINVIKSSCVFPAVTRCLLCNESNLPNAGATNEVYNVSILLP